MLSFIVALHPPLSGDPVDVDLIGKSRGSRWAAEQLICSPDSWIRIPLRWCGSAAARKAGRG